MILHLKILHNMEVIVKSSPKIEIELATKVVKVGSADWNASKGESGYIKNKPFFDNINTKIETPDVNLDEIDSVSINTQRGIYEVMVVKYPVYLIETGEIIGHKLLVSYWGAQESVRIPHPAGYVDLTITINEDDQYVLVFNWITYDTIDVISDVRYGFYGGYEEELIKRIDDFYIPDTIARTKDVEETTDELREETTALWENLDHGKFPNLVAGDLYGHGESVPAEFSFRATGGKSIKDGVAYIKELHGNAVVWNQWVDTIAPQDCDLSETDNRLTLTPQGGFPGVTNAISMNIVENHVYICISHRIGGGILNVNCGGYDGATNVPFRAESGHYGFSVYSYNETQPFTITRPMLIDLTKMFEAGNEPTTIEEYYARKPIVAYEYAYNEGEVIAFNGDAVKSVGDNAWDEEWRLGYYVGGGQYFDSPTQICSKNPIQVLPNESYCINQEQYYVWYYDKEMQFIGYDVKFNSDTFVTPSNAAYIHFNLEPPYGVTYKHDIMLTLVHSGWKVDTDAGYQPYWADTLLLNDPRIAKEFPNGMMPWDKVYNKDGKGYIVKGTASIKMADYVTNKEIDGVFVLKNLPKTPAVDTNGYSKDILSANYTPSLGAYGNVTEEKNICAVDDLIWVAGQDLLQYASVAEYAESLGDTMAWYKIAEPEILEFDTPFKLDYKVADFGTEEIISSNPSAPFKGRVIYQFNAVDQIRENYNEIEKIKAALAKAGITL